MREAGVAIIGGGPAGLSAAIVAARLGARVSMLEASARVGGKILATGNGRCNLSNLAISPGAYNHPEFVAPVLEAFPPEAVLSFFGELGLLTYADEQDRVYPVTNVANSVLDVLRLECEHLGVEQRVGFRAGSVGASADGGFEIHHGERETLRADAVVIATGGADRLLAETGHDAVPHVPVLGPLVTDTAPIRGLSGIRVRCAATLLAAGPGGVDSPEATPLATERGELLFREYGVSGIMIFDLSRFAQDDCVLSIDFVPDIAAGELRSMLAARAADLA
ncbi:MAG: aminoacetone oxidase family FAD-binding enzyme, partial [Coriobacteriia bacterium]